MPEGPELHLASRFVNEACRGLVFGGCVEKSPISRNPEVPFESSAYHISASARGKELRLTLSPLLGAQPPREPLALVFRFGMSGSFQLAPSDALPAHAHLRFYTAPPGPRRALCFVDIRRFGHWDLGGEWQPGRGPCVLLEYEQFRENVLRNLADKAFDRPICEALLDQRFFNGIGNYLRAEILYRGILDLWHPKETSPKRRNPREHRGVLRTEWRTLHLQASPLPGHERHGEAFRRKLQPSCLRGLASSRTQKSPQLLRKGRGGGNRQPQAAADPRRSTLTSHLWSLRGPQPPSRRISQLASTPSRCLPWVCRPVAS
ncbi:PREDICTED: endonuclease 8-like 1 isoform X3 [Hipposideros armiger]|uniref:Endonuclease 8-like 1 isoform X3 n=1 Tax=Hipposideros armiger TaxID=186990 RepID=A0A8B7PXV0_HIPAR|nr:PREDICTED: endonuclease 8-like 1 isoform X3 [Hipposideros armiger]